MERTAQTVGLVTPERQIGTAMRAVAIEQTPAALRIAEQHQILPQHAHRLTGRVAMRGSSAGSNSSRSATGCQ